MPKHLPQSPAALLRTKAGRLGCLTRVHALAAECGATVEHPWEGIAESYPDRATLRFGPYLVQMHLERGAPAFIGHWHTDFRADAVYPKDFASVIFGTMNTYHQQKATTCETDFEAFLSSLRAGFIRLARQPR